MPRQFSWLHLGDLRVQNETADIIRRKSGKTLLADLRRRWDWGGASSGQSISTFVPDVVFVTGDLTFSGSAKQGGNAAASLDQLRMDLADHGRPEPVILVVPGNHDVDRRNSPVAKLLRYWSEDPGLESSFWDSGEYLDEVRGAFRTFSKTAKGLQPAVLIGLLPGDFSITIKRSGVSVGVVGLNSAFVQLSEGDYVERLVVHPRQLYAVTGPDPDAWAHRHDFCILMTHHPPGWLSERSRTQFRHEISPPGRFALHLCSHQHGSIGYIVRENAMCIAAPAANPESSGPPGYIAGRVDLEDGSVAMQLRRFVSGSWVDDESFDSRALQAYRVQSNRAKHLAAPAPFSVYDLEIRNFRAIEHLKLHFAAESTLPGRWTCIAGVNGAGKSSVLQALCLVLIGRPAVGDLGTPRLNAMRRIQDGKPSDAEIRVWFEDEDGASDLRLRLGDEVALDKGEPWKRLKRRVIAAYGATRSLSSRNFREDESIAPEVRMKLTLFEPMSQLMAAEVLLEKQSQDSPLLALIGNLVGRVFGDDLGVDLCDGGVHFTQGGEPVRAIDLPDGFRSSVAWMTDLCRQWVEKNPEKASSADPERIEALLLIDEIDLHLHPSLQRKLVPALRKALPRVQWIVTTHSPLILSSFDSAEIIALDRQAPGGVRFLDRQILGFSADDIINWLMETPTTSVAMEEELRAALNDPDRQREAAEILQASPFVDEKTAKLSIKEMMRRLERMKT